MGQRSSGKLNLRHIYRHRGRGWRVCVTREGQHWEKHFLDRKWNGEKRWLQAAMEYRNTLLQMIPIKECKRHKLNRSGILGVSRDYKINPSGKRYPFWAAQWREGGKSYLRKFSVNHYGEREAKAMAIQTREEAMERKRTTQKMLLK